MHHRAVWWLAVPAGRRWAMLRLHDHLSSDIHLYHLSFIFLVLNSNASQHHEERGVEGGWRHGWPGIHGAVQPVRESRHCSWCLGVANTFRALSAL